MNARPIAFVAGKTEPIGKTTRATFAQLADLFACPMAGPKDGPGWLPADIEPGPRTQARVQSVSFLALDIEKAASEPPAVDDLAGELRERGWRAILHTSYSHEPEHPRYRVIFDLSRPLAPQEVRPLGLHVAAELGLRDCIDTSCLEPARLFYFGRVAAERMTMFERVVIDGAALDVDALLTEATTCARAQDAPRRPRPTDSVIDAFNQAHDVGAILERHGYVAKQRGRWLWPGSQTGIPGVRLLPDDGRGERVYSSHRDDPLHDGHAHDAFDLVVLLDHGGDVRAAVKDAAALRGLERGRSQAHEPGATEGHGESQDAPAADSGTWPKPHPLSVKVEPEAYPLDALPDTIRAAVEEVAGFVKAPIPLVASSAIGALSVAGQAFCDLQRADKLHGPTGLFLLTIADSGERKSTCDGFFTKAIRDYQDEQAELAKPELKKYAASIAAWNAEREGVLSAVKAAGKANKPTDRLRSDLGELETRKPETPRIPHLLLGDETPENLAWRLAKHWPSAGVLSSEAGIVLGSHGMSKDSVMRNLALLNVLWDGGTHSVGRRTSESFTVRGARLTVGLQIQEATLREFFARSGALARGTGFLARFLVAWPESTQGSRPFTEAPQHWPHLAAFHRRMAAILNQPVPMDEDGALTPAMLTFTSDAKAAWVTFHDAIEAELRSGGELYDVRDVASKAADNAARLAGLFQVFEHGAGPVGLDCFERASRIAAWHLSESRRFFGELALPAELADAARLDGWLIEHCRRERTHVVGKNHVRQHGPLRDGGRLDAALRELALLDRTWIEQAGKRLMIRVNPELADLAS